MRAFEITTEQTPSSHTRIILIPPQEGGLDVLDEGILIILDETGVDAESQPVGSPTLNGAREFRLRREIVREAGYVARERRLGDELHLPHSRSLLLCALKPVILQQLDCAA